MFKNKWLFSLLALAAIGLIFAVAGYYSQATVEATQCGVGTGSGPVKSGTRGPDTLTADEDHQILKGGLGDDVLNAGACYGVTLEGGQGDDTLNGNGLKTECYGGTGDDTLFNCDEVEDAGLEPDEEPGSNDPPTHNPHGDKPAKCPGARNC